MYKINQRCNFDLFVQTDLTETFELETEGRGTEKLKLGVRAVGTLGFDDAAEALPPNNSSLIFLRSSAVKLAVPLAAKKLASWELTSPGEGKFPPSSFAMLVLGVLLVGMLFMMPVSLWMDRMSPKVCDERRPPPKVDVDDFGRY